MFKLYVYDHCPFCVRARMPFGLKNISHELVFLPNDDEETPIRLIKRKMLPILEDKEGAMGESLDIVHKLDNLNGIPLFSGTPAQTIVDWIQKWEFIINGLVIPRTPDPIYPEFREENSRTYFTRKKEATFGDFNILLARTDLLKSELRQGLDELVPLLPDARNANIDDILLFPTLRSLTIMPDLEMPKEVTDYVEVMAECSGVPLVSTLREADLCQ